MSSIYTSDLTDRNNSRRSPHHLLGIHVVDHDLAEDFRSVEVFHLFASTHKLVACESSAGVLHAQERVDAVVHSLKIDGAVSIIKRLQSHGRFETFRRAIRDL